VCGRHADSGSELALYVNTINAAFPFCFSIQQIYPTVHAIGYVSVVCVIVYVICFAAGLGMTQTHSSRYTVLIIVVRCFCKCRLLSYRIILLFAVRTTFWRKRRHFRYSRPIAFLFITGAKRLKLKLYYISFTLSVDLRKHESSFGMVELLLGASRRLLLTGQHCSTSSGQNSSVVVQFCNFSALVLFTRCNNAYNQYVSSVG